MRGVTGIVAPMLVAFSLLPTDARAADKLDDVITCATYATLDYVCREQKDRNDKSLGRHKTVATMLHGRSIRAGATAGLSEARVGALVSITTDEMTKEVGRGCINIDAVRRKHAAICQPMIDESHRAMQDMIEDISGGKKGKQKP